MLFYVVLEDCILYDNDMSRFPEWLHLRLTYKCIRNCIYCHSKYVPKILYNKYQKNSSELTFSQLQRLVSELKGTKSYLDIYGGEPFLHPNIWDFLRLCVENQIVFSVTTKKAFSKSEVSRLSKIGVKKICVSIDSAIPSKADYLAGTEGFFNSMISSITHLIESNIEVHVQSLICNYTIVELDQLFSMMLNLGVTSLRLADFQPASHSIVNSYQDDVLKYRDQLELSDYNRRILGDFVKNYSNPEMELIESFFTGEASGVPSPCPIKDEHLYLHPDGKAYICNMFVEFIVGDFMTHSVEEIWNSEAMQTLRNPPRSVFEGTECFEWIGVQALD
jgi:MoaA/NifB/PqqE/SkfB family radical SAM enzyme